MKLTFRIEYRTAWGENIGVMLQGQENQPIMLGTHDGIIWEGGRESGTMAHIFCPSKKRNSHYILNDAWKDLPAYSHLYSSAFSGNYTIETAPKDKCSGEGDIVFRALCPCLRHRKQILGICGRNKALGYWVPSRFVRMEPSTTYQRFA